ncbi:MAG: hypothetical protein DMG11_19185 [Acidobacteria bacterium]|jgi:hypothetical protein|nr:MAG: hypothetical protein DMG11_19185 [Acidobacteriota bacterium]
MIEKFKIAFADFLHSLHRFWLEVIGGVFLALGVVFTFSAIKEYREYLKTPENGILSVGLTVFFSFLMLLFALESFWKSRKPR